ncbi:hypothetical protein NDA16_002745 [Ustilago loliicola]|nr:hypothetical protein NDA16_002745 [Ustilago loliicola]
MPLPAANQASLAAPVDPKLANQLNRFHLRLCLLQHPALLLCARPDCTHRLPLNPTLAKVIAHLKSHHHPLTKTGKEMLAETLAALNLDDPSMVNINPNLLPVNIIKELDILHKGYQCSMWWDAALKQRVAAFFTRDAKLMAKAELDMEGIQLHQSMLEWMNTLLQAGRQVQQTFHTFNDDISQPYSLDKSTIKKRADCWAFLITMLIFVTMDGQCLGYYGNDDQEAHLGVSDDFLKVITHLQGIYKHAIDPEVNCDAFTCAHFDKEAEVGLSAASYLLIIQELVEYGQLEHLALVCIYLHLCLSPDSTAKPVNDATSILVNLEFAFCAVMHHHLLHPDHGTVVRKLVKDINKAVVTNLKCYLHNNSHSSSGHLQSLLCYGTKLAQDDGGNLQFRWSDDCKSVTYGTDTIKVSSLQTLVCGTLDRATSMLEQLLLQDGALSKHVDLRTYKDNLHSQQPGYNFITASDLDVGIFCIHQAARGDAPPHQPLLDPYGAELEFDRDAANSYFALHNEFSKLLAVLIELTSGLPARGTELVRLQHTNTLVSQRNLFLADSHFVTVLVSNKGKGPPKLIPRFLPHAVGQLVLFYVMEVVPFLHLLYNAVEKPREPSALLLVNHEGKLWQTNDISKTLQSLCQEFAGPSASSLHMRNWHQLSVSIDWKLICPGLPSEEYNDQAHDLQAGHSTATAQQHYGLDARMLHQLTQERMDAMLSVSRSWHAFWGLPSRYQDAVQLFNTLVHSKLASCDDSVPLAIKRKLDSLEEDMCHIRRKLDEQTPLAPAANSAISSHITNPSSRSVVLAPLISQALFKVTSSYRTKTLEQAYALNAIYSKESPLIIVMATGSGKSVRFMALLFWLPCSSVVVVVVPFLALTEDLLEQCCHVAVLQCCHVGISASKWSGYGCARKVEGSQLVFVAAENCYSDYFGDWVQGLVQQECLAAIFFDECHVCITQDSFRPAMAKIKQLMMSAPVLQYFLTATPMLFTETENSKHILVGTTAIGTGINPQHVSLVVHMGRAYDMVSYVQESGCAGRSSHSAKAVMMVYKGLQLEDKVRLYADEKVCRRLVISSYMDSMPVTCLSQPDLALCDLCSQHIGGEPKTPPKLPTALDTPPRSDKPPHHNQPQHQQYGGSSFFATANNSTAASSVQHLQCSIFSTVVSITAQGTAATAAWYGYPASHCCVWPGQTVCTSSPAQHLHQQQLPHN